MNLHCVPVDVGPNMVSGKLNKTHELIKCHNASTYHCDDTEIQFSLWDLSQCGVGPISSWCQILMDEVYSSVYSTRVPNRWILDPYLWVRISLERRTRY
jgi:hypothetical protein